VCRSGPRASRLAVRRLPLAGGTTAGTKCRGIADEIEREEEEEEDNEEQHRQEIRVKVLQGWHGS